MPNATNRPSLPTSMKLYHMYHENTDDGSWVLIGHGNQQATLVSDNWADIKQRANELLGYKGGNHVAKAFAVVHWETHRRSGWQIKYLHMNASLELDGRSVSATQGGV